MKELIDNFSKQLNEAVEIALKQEFVNQRSMINNIVFTGMGGSGIGSKIVAQWIEKEIKVPITFVQNYEIPSCINRDTLVIATSYSGNTEETLTSIEKCLKQGALVVGICTGGKLKEICEENQIDCIIIPTGFPPRAALAYSLAQQLIVLIKFNLISWNSIYELTNCSDLIAEHKEEIKLKAQEIVKVINHTNPVIYAEHPYESVAIRGKQQINENGKYLCRYHTIPEMNHNELLGWGSGNENHSAIFLYNSDMNTSNLKRFELTQKIIENETKNVIAIHSRGNNQIEESIYFIHLLDWTSYYLGIERGADVMEIEKINFLKKELALIK